MRVLAVISSAALFFSGIWCFANYGVSFMGMAFVIGLVLVFSGLTGVMVYLNSDFGSRIVKDSLNWFLAETVIFFILGVIVLSNRLVGDSAVQFVFGILVLYAGIVRVIAYFRRIRGSEYMWILTLVFAVLAVFIGIYVFFNLTTIAIPTIIIVGVLLFLCGIHRMIFAVAMNSFSFKTDIHDYLVSEEKDEEKDMDGAGSQADPAAQMNSVVADLKNWEGESNGI